MATESSQSPPAEAATSLTRLPPSTPAPERKMSLRRSTHAHRASPSSSPLSYPSRLLVASAGGCTRTGTAISARSVSATTPQIPSTATNPGSNTPSLPSRQSRPSQPQHPFFWPPSSAQQEELMSGSAAGAVTGAGSLGAGLDGSPRGTASPGGEETTPRLTTTKESCLVKIVTRMSDGETTQASRDCWIYLPSQHRWPCFLTSLPSIPRNGSR